jgi:hypothetical protein
VVIPYSLAGEKRATQTGTGRGRLAGDRRCITLLWPDPRCLRGGTVRSAAAAVQTREQAGGCRVGCGEAPLRGLRRQEGGVAICPGGHGHVGPWAELPWWGTGKKRLGGARAKSMADGDSRAGSLPSESLARRQTSRAERVAPS